MECQPRLLNAAQLPSPTANHIAVQLSELDGTGAVNYVTEFKWRQLNSNATVDGSEIPNNHRLDGAKTL